MIGSEIIFVAASFIVLIVWNLTLLWQNKELMDRLMSKNYGDYAAAKSFLGLPQLKEKEETETVDPYDEQKAKEINGIMGMGS